MASNFLSRPGQPASPLIALANYFREARQRDGLISVTQKTSEAIQQYRRSQALFKADEIEVTVDAIDVGDSTLCNRLDRIGVAVFCSVLSYSEPCRAQQRGLCLIAESLHGTPSDTPQVRADRRNTKMQVGAAAVSPLIKSFVVAGAPEQTRRWMGVLVLEMLRDCPENTKKIQDESDHRWKYLSKVIKHEKCQVLKLLAGSIIRQMLFHGVSPESFWSPEDDPDMYTRFPKSQYHDTQWVTSFEGFVSDLESQNVLHQESSVTFAHAVFVAGQRYDLHNVSAILVAISTDINIVIPASPNESAKFIDVPLSSVQEVSLDTTIMSSQSQTDAHVLVIQLATTTDTKFYMNAVSYTEDRMMLAFRTESAAVGLRDAIILGNPRRRVRVNHSESINVSQHLYDDNCEDSGNQDRINTGAGDLETMTSRVSDLVTQSPIGKLHLRTPEDESSSQTFMNPHLESVAVPATRRLEQKRAAKPSVSVATSGIAVHATDIMDLKANGDLAVNDAASEDGRPSFGRWQNGFKVIDEAPDFQSTGKQNNPLQGKVSGISEGSRTQGILSDANTNHHSIHASSSVLKPQGGQIVQAHHSGGDPVKCENIPVAQAALIKKVARQKQDENGIVEGDASFNPRRNLRASLETTAEGGFRISASPNSDASVSSKPESKPIKHIGGAKDEAILMGKAKAKEHSLTDNGDEYKLSISPRNPSTQQNLRRPAIKKFARKPKSGNKMQRSQIQTGPSSKAGLTKSSLKRNSNKGIDPKLGRAMNTASSTVPQSQGKSSFEATTNEDMMWNEGVTVEDEEAGPSSAKIKETKQKLIKRSVVSSGKELTKTQTRARRKKTSNEKPAPVSLTKPKSRRAAALIANKKLQGLDESDDIVCDEVLNIQPPQGKMAGGKARKVAPLPKALGQTSLQNIERNHLKQANHTELPKAAGENLAEENGADSNPGNVDLIDPVDSTATVPPFDAKIQGRTASTSNSPLFRNTEDGEEDVIQVFDSNPPIGDTAHGPNQTHKIAQPYAQKKALVDMAQQYPSQTNQAVQKSSHSRQTLRGEVDNMAGLRPAKYTGPGNHIIEQEHSIIKDNAVPPKKARLRDDLLPGGENAFQAQKDAKADKVMGENRSASPLERARNKRRKASTEPQDPFAAKLNSTILSEKETCSQQNSSENARPAQKTMHKHFEEPGKPHDRREINNEHPLTVASKTDADAKESLGGTKRKADTDSVSARKKVKLISQDIHGTSPPQSNADTSIKPKTPIVSKDRKSILISFDASGPLNQGRTSIKKSQRRTASTPPGEVSRDQRISKKRNANSMATSTEAENSEPRKRQRLVLSKEAANQASHIPLDEGSVSKFQEMPPGPNSQNTRVKENGSPMPFTHPRNDRQASEYPYPNDEDVCEVFVVAHVEQVDDDQEMHYDEEQPRPDVLSTHDASMPHGIEVKFGNLSSNSKQRPSSPNAPSAASALTAHHVYGGGQIINAETQEEVVPAEQQDPFNERRQHRQNSFLSLLRKSNDLNARLSDQKTNRGASIQIKNPKPRAVWDDPDKTLVDTEEVHKSQGHKVIPNTSSISNSSPQTVFSEEDSNTEEVSDDEDDDEFTTQWRAALKPHQENIMSSLEDVSHGFLKHLIKRESIFEDMIEDYRKGGKMLLRHFADEYQGTLRTYGASTNELKKTMASLFEKTLADVDKLSKRAPQIRAKDLESTLRRDRQALMARGKTALATCN